MRRVMIAVGVLFAGCARGEAAKTAAPAVAPVVVPAAAEHASEQASPPPPRSAPAEEEAMVSTETRASFELRLNADGGNVVFTSTPDSGVNVWGTFNRSDGGFSFSGGFSTRSSDAGAP